MYYLWHCLENSRQGGAKHSPKQSQTYLVTRDKNTWGWPQTPYPWQKIMNMKNTSFPSISIFQISRYFRNVSVLQSHFFELFSQCVRKYLESCPRYVRNFSRANFKILKSYSIYALLVWGFEFIEFNVIIGSVLKINPWSQKKTQTINKNCFEHTTTI